jgi:hypothetical protein
MATRKFQEVYAELEYYNKQNTLVYYRNNLTRNDFVKVKDELYVLSDQKTFRGLDAVVEIKVHSHRIKDIFDDKLPEGVFIKGGLNGFGIVIVVSEKNAFSPFHSLIGKLEISIVFSGSLEKIPWNDSMREKTYLKSYRMNPTYNTFIPSSFNAGSWRSK